MLSDSPHRSGGGPASRRSSLRVVAAIGAVLALAIVAAVGGTASTAGASPAAGSTLNWALASSPPGLFTPSCFSTDCGIVFGNAFMRILEPGTFGQPTTGENTAIESWKAVNPTTYVYKVRPGIKFADGTPITAADVAFSINIHLNKKLASLMTLFFDGVKSVRASGNAVTVKLTQPNSNWPYILAGSPGVLYSKADYLKHSSNYGNSQNIPVSSGPYKITEFQVGDHATLVRNPFWKGTKYKWDTIRFSIIPDQQARLLALQSGQIDGTFAVPNTNIDLWQKAPNVKAGAYISGGWRGFTIDVEDGPFKDVHVRRAMAYATDRNGLTQAGTSGRGAVLDYGLPPLIFLKGVLPASELNAELKKIKVYPYDLDKAKAELKLSAYPNGFTTTLNVPVESLAATNLSQGLAQSLSKIGINVKLNFMAGQPRFQIILDHGPNLGIQVIGEAPDSPNPLWYLDLYFNSIHAAKGYGNSSNYKNAAVDKWLAEGFATGDLKVAARNALKIMQATSVSVPYISVFSFPGAWATTASIGGVKSSIGPFVYNQVWIKNVKSS